MNHPRTASSRLRERAESGQSPLVRIILHNDNKKDEGRRGSRIVSLVRHHNCGSSPAPGTARGATNVLPTSPTRPVAALRLTLPPFVVSVDHKDPTGCRGGKSISQRRRARPVFVICRYLHLARMNRPRRATSRTSGAGCNMDYTSGVQHGLFISHQDHRLQFVTSDHSRPSRSTRRTFFASARRG